MKSAWASVCLAVAALLCCLPAAAHQRSTSTSQWTVGAANEQVTAEVSLGIPWRGLAGAIPEIGTEPRAWEQLSAADQQRLRDYFFRHFVLFVAGKACAPVSEPTPVAVLDDRHLGLGWRCQCPASGDAMAELQIDLFLHEDPSHLHLARVKLGAATAVERIFMQGRTRTQLVQVDALSRALAPSGAPEPAAHGESFLDFVQLGIHHIATGFDHIVFLLGLLVVAGGLRDVIRLITGFTVAHSITLAAGVLGWVHPTASAVEALIGLSIAVVALENFSLTTAARTRATILIVLGSSVLLSSLGAASGYLAIPTLALLGVGLFSVCYLKLVGELERPERLRWFVAFAFGLVHGFGFAGLLSGIGLPPGRVGVGLLGFNLGVELGQLALVLLVWPLLRRWLKPGLQQARERLAVQLASLPTLIAGLYWFVTRLFV